jgi:DNA replication and repair protein RecF
LVQTRLSEYVGHLNVVLFAPEDLELVKGPPSVRRRFLDIEIGQIQSSYLYHLAQYKRALAQKNKYLQSINNKLVKHDDLLSLWNEQCAQHAVKLIQKRVSYLHKLSDWALKIHRGITNNEESLDIRYQASLGLSDEIDETVLISDYMLKLEMMQEKEIRRGNALVGPHRDDLQFFINEKEVQLYGSQGQQRTAALSLKLAEIELIKEVVGEYPLLLLDDVLSELDEIRQTHLIHTFQDKVQTFITTTSTANIDMHRIQNAASFYVSQGKISTRG